MVTVDDYVPLDKDGAWLLPRARPMADGVLELWPVLLSKALIKVVCMSFERERSRREFGDASLLQVFTGLQTRTEIIRDYDTLIQLLSQCPPEMELVPETVQDNEPEIQQLEEKQEAPIKVPEKEKGTKGSKNQKDSQKKTTSGNSEGNNDTNKDQVEQKTSTSEDLACIRGGASYVDVWYHCDSKLPKSCGLDAGHSHPVC